MSDVKQLIPIQLKPGIQRDGTELDTREAQFIDGEWVRFQQGRPRKMGGYIRISDRIRGPVRASTVVAYNGAARVLSFSPIGIQSLFIDEVGLGAYLNDRTPSGFSSNDKYMWSVAQMYDDAAGADQSIVLAVATETLDSVDSINVGQVYYGNAQDETDAFVSASGITCRGLFVTEPYAVYYGPNGSVTWSNTNEPLNITTGEAGSDRVTRSGFVAGLPMPTGTGPGGLLWSLDSVIRMDYVGGQAIFKFTKLTTSSSIMSQNAVVEMDGVYYWIGNDKFYVSDGSQVKELINTSNRNWFFSNLNRNQRTKIWAERNTSFSEIIWHFPSGTSEECDKVIIYNTKENCWYDSSLSRTAGSNYWQNPLLYSTVSTSKLEVTLSGISGTFSVGDIVRSTLTDTRYEIELINDSIYYLTKITQGEDITVADVLVNISASGQGAVSTVAFNCSIYQHEFGVDWVEGDFFYAIPSSFTTANVSLLPVNRWTRLIRVEPDFVQTGEMSLEVLTKEFPNSDAVSFGPYLFNPETEKIDLRVQGRVVYLKFKSNTSYGFYQMGRPFIHVEPGDPRS